MWWSELLEIDSDANLGTFGTMAARVIIVAVAMIVVGVEEHRR